MGEPGVKPKPILIDLLIIIALLGVIWLVSGISGTKQERQDTEITVQQDQVGEQSRNQSDLDSNLIIDEVYDARVTPEHTLAGIAIDYSADQVLAVLGEPINKETSTGPFYLNPQFTERMDTWTYDGVKVILFRVSGEGDPPLSSPGGVIEIDVSSGSHRSMNGVGIGDPAERVQRLYPERVGGNEPVGAYLLNFAIKGGSVTSMDLSRWPD